VVFGRCGLKYRFEAKCEHDNLQARCFKVLCERMPLFCH